jgi:excisionase family DNA binding protein
MATKELELISASENEKPALQKMEGVLNREIPSSQPVNSSLPMLIGPEGEKLEIPISVFRALQKIVNYMMRGKAFSVIPYDQLFSTQEAADFLNVSRPFVVQILEEGEIPFIKVGTHRRVQFSDLLEYKNRMRQERHKALAEMARISQEAGEY